MAAPLSQETLLATRHTPLARRPAPASGQGAREAVPAGPHSPHPGIVGIEAVTFASATWHGIQPLSHVHIEFR